jgi:peptidoglycan LD-endopeptidase CwlK
VLGCVVVRDRFLRPLLLACPMALLAGVPVGLASPVGEVEACKQSVHGPGSVYRNIPVKDDRGREQRPMFCEWNSDPVGNHEAALNALGPSLARVIRKTQADNPGLRFVIGSGRRDQAAQRRAMAWGWSRTPDSHHASGDAVDLWPLDADGRVIFDPAAQDRIGAAMKKAAAELRIALRWGGHFVSYKGRDRSHFELVPAWAAR